MEMGSRRVAGAALVADQLAAHHDLAVAHREARHVAVHGDVAVAVVDDDVVAVSVRAVVDEGDPGGAGADRRAPGVGDVDAGVEVAGGGGGGVGGGGGRGGGGGEAGTAPPPPPRPA